jgi:hypothetical protein
LASCRSFGTATDECRQPGTQSTDSHKGHSMLQAFNRAVASTRPRQLVLAVLAALLDAGCSAESPDPLAVVDASGPLASVTYVGIPFGPVALWNMNKLLWGPYPFTASQNYINADTLILQINAARNKGQRLMVAMTGGPSTRYTTNGQFDMTKWKAVMNTYNKSTLKTAVAAAVSDGTIIGDQMIDEPETKRWGTVLTKATLDQMAAYVKSIFPTLPVGLNHGPPGYKWRSTEHYTKVDYVLYQYAYYITSGNVTSWRDAVLAQAKLDGVRPALSVNILNGGKQDQGDGLYDCIGTGMGGLGTYYPNCQTTADQLKSWGTALTPYACFMMMWQFDSSYMAKTANKDAFKAIATLAASKPKPTCRRP